MCKYNIKSLNSYPSFDPEIFVLQTIKLRDLRDFFATLKTLYVFDPHNTLINKL